MKRRRNNSSITIFMCSMILILNAIFILYTKTNAMTRPEYKNNVSIQQIKEAYEVVEKHDSEEYKRKRKEIIDKIDKLKPRFLAMYNILKAMNSNQKKDQYIARVYEKDISFEGNKWLIHYYPDLDDYITIGISTEDIFSAGIDILEQETYQDVANLFKESNEIKSGKVNQKNTTTTINKTQAKTDTKVTTQSNVVIQNSSGEEVSRLTYKQLVKLQEMGYAIKMQMSPTDNKFQDEYLYGNDVYNNIVFTIKRKDDENRVIEILYNSEYIK